jgi:four helix bundle protein
MDPKPKSYQDLEIYQVSFNLAVRIRENSLKLPNPDRYEVGGQIRRSSQTTKDTIVEGYGRRRYKPDFIKFLVYSYSSNLEAKSQAEFIHVAYPKDGWDEIVQKLDILGMKIHRFITYVEKNWKT